MSKLTLIGIGGAWDPWLNEKLKQAGFEVSQVSPSQDLVVSITEMRSPLVLFAPSIPKATFFEVCRAVRLHKETMAVGIVVLADEFTVEDRVEGLSAGADDCIPTSSSMDELVARLASIMRRLSQDDRGSILQSGEIRLDRTACRVTRKGKAVPLGPVEYRLLEELMRNKGHVVDREMLLSRGWPNDTFADDVLLNERISRLRKALSCQHGRKFIRTVRGVGYRFNADD